MLILTMQKLTKIATVTVLQQKNVSLRYVYRTTLETIIKNYTSVVDLTAMTTSLVAKNYYTKLVTTGDRLIKLFAAHNFAQLSFF